MSKQSIEPMTLTCRDCRIEQHLSHFRLRYKNGINRVRQCRSCHNYKERRRRRERSAQQVDAFIRRTSSTHRDESLKRLCCEMIDHFGGPSQLASAWSFYLQKVAECETGTRRILDSTNILLRLVQSIKTL